jgi:hypothetical protein
MVSSLPQTVPGPALLLGLEAFLSLFFYPSMLGAWPFPQGAGPFCERSKQRDTEYMTTTGTPPRQVTS